MIRTTAFLSILLGVTTAPGLVQAQSQGDVSFATSGAPAAQASFLEGLARLHNFEYGPAAASFRAAEQIDPDFAMAYWGEAMTFNHPVWMQQDRSAALAALAKLAPTPDARAAKAKTGREKDYLRAIEILYGDGDKNSRDFKYSDAMASLHQKYPDDVDATAFYALSLLGTAHEGRDFATYMKSAALLEPAFATHPRHPGLAHYLIHSYDDPIHAPLGLRAARAYSTIAPASAHAQHMCSHIFVAMGMWDDVVTANETAVAVTNRALAAHGTGPVACGHYPEWLEYGYLEQGRWNDAKKSLSACYAAARASKGSDRFETSGFAGMRARYLLDTEDWTGDVAGWHVARGVAAADFTSNFVDGFAAARVGRVEDARSALDRLKAGRLAIEAADKGGDRSASEQGRMVILEQELTALVAAADGKTAEALALAREAAGGEEKLPFEFGPPSVDKPTWEFLGEMLLTSNDAAGARAAFEKSLQRTPDRTTSVKGLMRSAEAMGDRQKAAEIRARLDAIWHIADKPVKTSRDK